MDIGGQNIIIVKKVGLKVAVPIFQRLYSTILIAENIGERVVVVYHNYPFTYIADNPKSV